MRQRTMPNTPAELVQLPTPTAIGLARAKSAVLEANAEYYLRRWLSLASEFESISQHQSEYVCPKCGKSKTFTGLALWHRMFLITASYYECAVRTLILRGLDNKRALPPGLTLNSLSSFVDGLGSTEKLPFEVQTCYRIQIAYRFALFGAYFIGPFRRVGHPNFPLAPFEENAHTHLETLQELRKECRNVDVRNAVSQLSAGIIKLLSAAYAVPTTSWNAEHKLGPFSLIRLPELSLLARRDPVIVKRYGTKQIESLFEQQLSLILQSFGFVVVRTRRGDRTVDLVCISGDPRQPMTILVEAKTTKGAYSLPTDDERALLEYVRDVRENLTTMPPLAFVLIIAPKATSTIEAKLASIEAKAGTPIRLISGSDFAQLRESIAGPLMLGPFKNAVLTSTTRLLSNLPVEQRDAQRGIDKAHETLVRTCLPGARQAEVAVSHWDHDGNRD